MARPNFRAQVRVVPVVRASVMDNFGVLVKIMVYVKTSCSFAKPLKKSRDNFWASELY